MPFLSKISVEPKIGVPIGCCPKSQCTVSRVNRYSNRSLTFGTSPTFDNPMYYCMFRRSTENCRLKSRTLFLSFLDSCFIQIRYNGVKVFNTVKIALIPDWLGWD